MCKSTWNQKLMNGVKGMRINYKKTPGTFWDDENVLDLDRKMDYIWFAYIKTDQMDRLFSWEYGFFKKFMKNAYYKKLETFQNFLTRINFSFCLQGTKTEISHPLVYFPNASNRQGWARPKPRAQNSILISHVCSRNTVFEPSPATSPPGYMTARSWNCKWSQRRNPATLTSIMDILTARLNTWA